MTELQYFNDWATRFYNNISNINCHNLIFPTLKELRGRNEYMYTNTDTRGVSGGILNILVNGSIDCSE
jgi:hypothetical protein